MIRSTFGGFNTALLGLTASQKAIDVTGQNLSNINTQGYTRQRLDQVSMNPPGPSLANSQYGAKVGQGVLMTGVSQVRDPFLDVQYRNQLPKVGTADAMDSILAQIGQIFDETDKDAIAVQFNDIIKQLQNLADAENTGTVSADTVVRSACEVLLNTIRQNGTEIQELYDEVKTKLKDTLVPDINAYLKDIVEKNIAIKNTQVLGNPGLELMDARNELIDSLATYFPIDVQYEKQNLGGGIVVDVLNIDLKLSNGQKVRLVADNMCGEVGVALKDDGSIKDQPVEFYVKSAEENPKTYGGGLEVLQTELPKEIQSYIDDIAELNESIRKTQDRIASLEKSLADTTASVAKTHQDKMNKYIDEIATLNKTVTDRTAEMDALNGQITALQTRIKDLQTSFKNATTTEEKQRIKAQIETEQNNLTRLNSEVNAKQNERIVAEGQRSRALNNLKDYFPANTIQSSVGPDRVMTVTTTTTTTNPSATGTSILVSRDATGDIKGEITAVDTDTDPISYTIKGAGTSASGAADANKKIKEAIDSAVDDIEKQLKELRARIPRYEKERLEKVNGDSSKGITGLKDYFPENSIIAKVDGDDIMTVYLGPKDPADADPDVDPILVSMNPDGTSQKGSVSYNNGKLDVTGYGQTTATSVDVSTDAVERITGSINDRLMDGVIKGNLDMVNKSEVFDADITDPNNHIPASDTKGIQFYQKMLDSFVNKLATIMNELNEIEVEVPDIGADGKQKTQPVRETVWQDKMENGQPVVDANGDPVKEAVMFQKTEKDGTTKLYLDKDGNETTKAQDDQGNDNTPIMVPWRYDTTKTEPATKTVRIPQQLFETTGEKVALYTDADGNWTTDPQTNGVNNTPVELPKMDDKGNLVKDKDDKAIMEPVMVSPMPTTYTALNIKVSDAWMKGDVRINTKQDPLGEGNSSDNWNVDKMIDELSQQTHSFVDPKSGEVYKGTLYECYTGIQGTQSVERKATSLILDTRTTVLDQIADDKDSVSGVWMDEEVMSLMKYSQSYNAASRLMTVMDEVLERLITQTGACGR